MVRQIIVIGGGAAGMMASIVAQSNGAQVILLERNSRVGKKILATGNGRCNYTNMYIGVKNYHGENPKFVYSPLSQFDVEMTLNFFERLGITPTIEEGGKVFPLSFQASSILDVLRFEMEDVGVNVVCDAFVSNIIKNNGKFIVTLENNKTFIGDKIIICTGGKAAPYTGSDGNGYTLSKNFGHTIVDTFPGLVQLKLKKDFLKQIDGVKIIGTAGLYSKERLIREDTGDILFTDYGISGPPILQISRKALELLNKGKKPVLKVSIIDTKTKEELVEYLKIRFMYKPKRTVEKSLIGFVNKRLIPVILKETNINRKKQVAQLSNEEIENLATLLIDWKFEIIGSKSYESAQVTAGGVSTKEIDNTTMESKLVKGLYFAGEVIDIDGDCGGFNLQWAWSSAYIAGKNAAIS